MPEFVETRRRTRPGARIEMPAPTHWPIVLALGVVLSIAGMVTEGYVTAVGVILFLFAARGWFREVIPRENFELLPIEEEQVIVSKSKEPVARLPSAGHQQVKPMRKFTLLPGLYGGLAGGAAMVVPAALYGLIKYGSVWYAVNLLAAGGFPSWGNQPSSFFAEFHMKGLLAGLVIMLVSAPLVGMLYSALLPMYPKRPILTAGIVIPLCWTALLWAVLGLVSPVLNERIDWWWFVPSQLAFGLVAGYVVNRFENVRTPGFAEMSFAQRAGLASDVSYREKKKQKKEGE